MGMRLPNQPRDPEREERRELIRQKMMRERMQEEQDFYSDPRNAMPQGGRGEYGFGDAALDMLGDVGSGLMEGGEYLINKFWPDQEPEMPPGWHPPMAAPKAPRGMTVGHAKDPYSVPREPGQMAPPPGQVSPMFGQQNANRMKRNIAPFPESPAAELPFEDSPVAQEYPSSPPQGGWHPPLMAPEQAWHPPMQTFDKLPKGEFVKQQLMRKKQKGQPRPDLPLAGQSMTLPEEEIRAAPPAMVPPPSDIVGEGDEFPTARPGLTQPRNWLDQVYEKNPAMQPDVAGPQPLPGMTGQAPQGMAPDEQRLRELERAGNRADMDYIRASYDRGDQGQIPLSQLFMKSAAQAGTIGGKQADTSGYDQFAKSLMGQEADEQNRRQVLANYLMQKRGQQRKDQKDLTFDREKLAYQREKDNLDRSLRAQGIELSQAKLDAYLMDLRQKGRLNEILAGPKSELIETQIESGKESTALARDKRLNPEKYKNAGQPKEFTKDERVAANFGRKMESADKRLAQLEKLHPNFDSANLKGRALDQAGFIGESMQDPRYKDFQQAELEFLAAVLRRESMASISKSEYDQYSRIYFVRPGDNESVKQRKRQARKEAIQGLSFESGGAFDAYKGGKGVQKPKDPNRGSVAPSAQIPMDETDEEPTSSKAYEDMTDEELEEFARSRGL